MLYLARRSALPFTTYIFAEPQNVAHPQIRRTEGALSRQLALVHDGEGGPGSLLSGEQAGDRVDGGGLEGLLFELKFHSNHLKSTFEKLRNSLLKAISCVILMAEEMKSEVFPVARAATRTANVFTRVDPETKEQAEVILNQLGIPMSNAIGMFLKQIVMHRGIPFEMKLPNSVPVAAGSLTKEQFDAKLQKGMDDIAAGRVLSADAVEAEMRSL